MDRKFTRDEPNKLWVTHITEHPTPWIQPVVATPRSRRSQYRRFPLVWGQHAATGLIMMIWVFVEIAIILVWSPLHGIYFATGVIQTTLDGLALGAWPRPSSNKPRRVHHPLPD